MKNLEFEKLDEVIYNEKLDNGIEVYMYPSDKTKNFYITISVKYGANTLKYKLNDKTFDVIPGSAHFLEHKVMSFSEDPYIVDRINKFGLNANAWTNWYGTNYNLYGSEHIEESLLLLLDMFYKPNINNKNVEEEKGIISEEIDMTNDNINVLMTNKLLDNMFYNSFLNKTVLGTKNDILNISAKSLNKIYNDFYVPGNTFITLTGNFDKDNMLNIIKDYFKNVKLKNKPVPKRIKTREKEGIKVTFEKIDKDIISSKVKIGYKIKKSIFGIKKDIDIKTYVNIILQTNLGISSNLSQEYKKNSLIINMGASSYIFDDYLVIIISANTSKPEEFIKRINEDIKNMEITKENFDRKKKMFLKNYILSFEDIIDIEYLIATDLIENGKINTKEYTEIMGLEYEKANQVLKKLNFNNNSVIIVSK